MNLDGVLIPRPDCLVAVAYTAGGVPVAFARFAVCADGSIYTLDVAPRGILAPNGTAERLIVEVVDYARAHGGREVSLNFAALRWVFDAPGIAARAGAAMLHGFDRWIEIASLNRFCEKFQPRWRPRSLLTPSWAQFGWVVAAAVRAELATPRQRRPTTTTVDGIDLVDGIGTAVNPIDASVAGVPLSGDGAVLSATSAPGALLAANAPADQVAGESASATDPAHIPLD